VKRYISLGGYRVIRKFPISKIFAIKEGSIPVNYVLRVSNKPQWVLGDSRKKGGRIQELGSENRYAREV